MSNQNFIIFVNVIKLDYKKYIYDTLLAKKTIKNYDLIFNFRRLIFLGKAKYFNHLENYISDATTFLR